MPADSRSIVITLKLDSTGEGESKPTDTSSVKTATDKDSTAKAVAAFAITQCVELVVSEAVSWGEYYWDRWLTLNDDYIGQRDKNVITTQINRGISAVSTVASMTAAGASVGGPIGAAIGAIIGVVTDISGFVRSNVQNQDQQNILIRQMEAQLDFTRSRAGWSLNAASIGEDL